MQEYHVTKKKTVENKDFVVIERLNKREDNKKFHNESNGLYRWVLKNGDVITHNGEEFEYVNKIKLDAILEKQALKTAKERAAQKEAQDAEHD